MSGIDPEALDERLTREDSLYVLDVRPEDDFRSGHIDGSQNAPVYDDLRSGDTEALDRYIDGIPRNVEVVTVCKAGVVARRATARLEERGYEASTLSGGIRRWRGYRSDSLTFRFSSLLRDFLS